MQRDLNNLSQPEDVVPPTEAFNAWHETLNNASAKQSHRRLFSGRWAKNLGIGLSAATIAAVGVMVGLSMSPPDSPVDARTDLAATSPSDGSLRAAAFVRQTSLDVSALSDVSEEERDRLIEDIIVRNRLYIRAAESNQSSDLARALRAFEPVLRDLANANVGEAAYDRTSEQLKFELGVLQTRFERRPLNNQQQI